MSDRDIPSKQKLIDMLAERSRKHDAFRLAETAFSDGRADGYADEMNAFDIAHGEVLDWLNDTDHLDELLGFLRAAETPANTLRLPNCPECGGAYDGFCIACEKKRLVSSEKAAEPRELAPSEAASFEKAFAASPRRIETRAVTRDADHCDFPDCEQHWTLVVHQLLSQCEAYHRALDTMFAQMIEKTANEQPHCFFFPTKSGQPWEACQKGHALIQSVRAALKTGPAPTCKTHGVELAFDGDECWECKKERQL